MKNKAKRKLSLQSNPQNRPFIAMGNVFTSFDLGAGQFAESIKSMNEWE